MLATKVAVNELDRFLEEKGYYSLERDKNIEGDNQFILEKWDANLRDSIVRDLRQKFSDIEIVKTRSLFDLISDQGVTLYKLFLDLRDKDEVIEIIVKLIINYNKAVIYLGSRHANERKLKGKSKVLKSILKELKKADRDFGYFLPVDFYTYMKELK